jgi:hypothetical protein
MDRGDKSMRNTYTPAKVEEAASKEKKASRSLFEDKGYGNLASGIRMELPHFSSTL